MKTLNQKTKSEIFEGNNWSEETIAIHREREFESVIFFRKLNTFTIDFIRMYLNGSIWGVYYHDNMLVAEDDSGNILENIEEN